jgi:hypothetical protein
LLVPDSGLTGYFHKPPSRDLFHRLFGNMADTLTNQVVSGYYGIETVPATVVVDVERIVARP